MNPINLFGEKDDLKEHKSITGYFKKWKFRHNYRKSNTQNKCGNCINSRADMHHNKIYWKCMLMGFSHSEASDIRKSYTCNNYKEEEDE